jgi:DNA-binding transcriptional LysR family regulator
MDDHYPEQYQRRVELSEIVCEDAIWNFRGPPSKILKMELYQLRTFAAIAELGSLTRAAQRLHVSQPAASAQIKQLEEHFGVALFERRPTGLKLTRAGTALLPAIQGLLDSASGMIARAKSFSQGVTGTVKFATVATLCDPSFLRVGEMIKLVVTRHPNLDIEVQHQGSRAIYAAVGNGDIDAGMCLGAVGVPNTTRILLKELRYRIVAPRNWGARVRRASWRELASAPWILTPKGGSHHQMATQLFHRLDRLPDKVIEADNEQFIVSSVRAGVGLGLMLEELALEEEQKGNVIVVEKGRPSTFLQVLHRPGREREPAVGALLDVLRELWSVQDRDRSVTQRVVDQPSSAPNSAADDLEESGRPALA